MSSSTIDTDLLERAVGKLPVDALMPHRREALKHFAEAGFPTTRHEDWKYTSLAPAIALSNIWLRDAAPAVAPVSDAARKCAAEAASAIDAHWVVILNGVFQGTIEEGSLSTSRQGLSLPGFEVKSIAADAGGNFARAVTADDPMTRFNTALMRDAVHVRIERGQESDKPLGLLILDDSETGPAVSQARVIVEAEANTHAAIIEYHASVGRDEHFANVVCELALAEDAGIDYLRLQQRGRNHFQVGRLNARLGRNAILRHTAFDLGGALVRNDVAVDIAEPGAAVELYGLYLADGEQHIDNHTRVDHRVGPAKSSEEYRGILSDSARCVFNGKALVHSGADGTDAQQANHNLLLSDKAEIDTKPELEIYADDVKCSHGATVGQLDKAAMFYLRSRGLDRAEAVRVMTRAFAATIVGRSTIDSARPHVEKLVDQRLQALAGGLL
ncbi:MAG: Fe-S cluster assembly protein SufD [Woeseia sp.]